MSEGKTIGYGGRREEWLRYTKCCYRVCAQGNSTPPEYYQLFVYLLHAPGPRQELHVYTDIFNTLDISNAAMRV